MAIGEQRRARVEVFRDTQRRIANTARLTKSLGNSRMLQYVQPEAEPPALLDDGHRFDEDHEARVLVSGKRTFEAAQAYVRAGAGKVCVLNFASATSPGGGVTAGASAQEECLCRCSTLYPCLTSEYVVTNFHDAHRAAIERGEMGPLYNDDCVFTPKVTVFKTDELLPEPMDEKDWYDVDVITCAAPNLSRRPSTYIYPGSGNVPADITVDDLVALHAARARRILDIAKAEQEDVVILGAFGCGAFYNPPEVVAWTWAQVVLEYLQDFETIEFAVWCPPGSPANREAFERFVGEALKEHSAS